MFNFGEITDILEGGSFEEKPVDIKTFCESEDYLGLPRLSKIQYDAIEASTQIYSVELLNELYPDDPDLVASKLLTTYNEVLLLWGKGSGKDFISTISCAYIVYLLLCLRDPQKSYGKPKGDYIDIMNIAINAKQASQVFFVGLKARIKNCPWFAGKFQERQGEIEFPDKFIRIISGHSESESLEGYNVLVVVLDEIDGFKAESTGTLAQTTAESIYKMHSASVTSRFGDKGKIVMLSFPRTKTGFIMEKYNSVVAEKVVTQREHTFKMDPKLPDGLVGNELVLNWTEDQITKYVRPGIYAIRRPSWEVNPTKTIEMYAMQAFTDLNDFLGRFCAEPVDAVEGFFKDHQKIETAFHLFNGVDNETGQFLEWFVPNPSKKYYVHVDLAQKHDRAAVAIAHVENFVQLNIGGNLNSIQPHVIVGAVRWWTPRPGKDIEFRDVSDYIVSLKQRGFDIQLVTFDRWRSEDMIKYLNSIKIKAELLSVLKPQYQDLLIAVQEERIEGPFEDLIIRELKEVVLLPNNKIEHPRKGGKDTTDAIAGAVFNAIKYTPREDGPIEIYTMKSFNKQKRAEELEVFESNNVIRAPEGTKTPVDIESWLERMMLL